MRRFFLRIKTYKLFKRKFYNRSTVSVFLIIFGFYGWTALTFNPGYEVDKVWIEHIYKRDPSGYVRLSEAFLSGQISMKELPKPELLALNDPYDPTTNAKFRHHDWALFQGKYYLSWSPVPALLLFIPANVLGIPMNSALACIFLGSVLLVLLFVLLRQIIPKSHHPSGLQSSLLILILGFGSYTPILLRRPADYEVAILTGSVFVILSLLLFVRSTTLLKHKSLNASFAVLASMLAFWSRPSFIFVPLLIAGFIIFNNRHNLKKIIYLICLPVASVAIPMGIYNHLRFGSIFEFGAKYQLAGIRLKSFSLSWIIPKLQSDLLAHRFFGFFPWTTTGESPFREKMYPNYNLEQNLGLLVAMPWTIVIFIIAWQQRKTLTKALDGRIQVLTIACFSAIGAWIIQLVAVPGTTSRYQGDTAPLLTLILLTLFKFINDFKLSLNVKFKIAGVVLLAFVIFQYQLFGDLPLTINFFLILIMVAFLITLRPIDIQLNSAILHMSAMAWTLTLIGLTSLSVGGNDSFDFLPYGFQWWES